MDKRYADLMSSEAMKRTDAGVAEQKKRRITHRPVRNCLQYDVRGRLYAVLGATEASKTVMIATENGYLKTFVLIDPSALMLKS